MAESDISINIEKKINDGALDGTPFENTDDSVYGKVIKPVPAEGTPIGVDIDGQFFRDIIEANAENKLDTSAIQSFSQLAQSRDQLYRMLDDMADDPTIAAVLRSCVENATELNDDGKIVWVESSDAECAKMVEFLLDTINVDKYIYQWVLSLCKYGDLYLRLFRESEMKDDLFKNTPKRKDSFNDYTNDIKKKEKKSLNEDVLIQAYSNSDHYSHYIEAMPNPAEYFELVKHGKACGYITANIATNVFTDNNPNLMQLRYGFKRDDVVVNEATEFVHACLDVGTSRVPETVDIFLTDKTDINSPKASYTVRKGKSLLYDAYQAWRLLSLLENAVLLNRVTKSQLIRLITLDVGGMSRDETIPLMRSLKQQLEQKTALNVNKYLQEYTNPGAVENNVYWTTRNNLGAISIQNIGGEYDPKSLVDLEYFRDKMFGALSVPKQFFGNTGDSTGFNGGSALSIISPQFAKKVKAVQNAIVQALTDAVNLMLLDKNLDGYVNSFQIKMTPPITQEELDRRENSKNKVGIAQDIINALDDIEDPIIKLKLKKALISKAVTDSEVVSLLQDQIDLLENQKEEEIDITETTESGTMPEAPDEESVEQEPPAENASITDTIDAQFGESPEEEETTILPTASELGVDMTQNA